jgi:hypothetical protein
MTTIDTAAADPMATIIARIPPEKLAPFRSIDASAREQAERDFGQLLTEAACAPITARTGRKYLELFQGGYFDADQPAAANRYEAYRQQAEQVARDNPAEPVSERACELDDPQSKAGKAGDT